MVLVLRFRMEQVTSRCGNCNTVKRIRVIRHFSLQDRDYAAMAPHLVVYDEAQTPRLRPARRSTK
jgi:hypothetical protein